MLLALHHPNFTLPGGPEALAPTLAKTAQAADVGGWSTMTLMDHYFQMESLSRAEDPMLEGYSSLGYLAGKTEHIQLGLLQGETHLLSFERSIVGVHLLEGVSIVDALLGSAAKPLFDGFL